MERGNYVEVGDARSRHPQRRRNQDHAAEGEAGHGLQRLRDDADLDAFLDTLTVEALAESRQQVCRGELATSEEVEAAYARFRR